jgi:CubicO group peptidase (beta-lactamase class C family)
MARKHKQMNNQDDYSNANHRLTRFLSNAIVELQPVFETGIAIAIVKNSKIYYASGFGYKDRTSFAKVNPKTIFQIGSNTKAFTSMLISMLMQDGKIALDCPIRNYIPDFRMQEEAASQNLTLAQILSHLSGLPRHDALWYLGPFSRAQLTYRLAYLDPIPGAYGKQFQYNSLMYMAAGYVAEVLLGKSWEELVQTRILDPIGMSKTTFTVGKLESEGNFAKAYERDVELQIKDFTNIGPAAEINSSAVDMANWLLLFLNNGMTQKGTKIIENSYLQDMYAEHVEVSPGLGYGLGWYTAQMQGMRFVFHPGDPDGYVSHMSFLPDDGLGVVVLTNQQVTTNLIGIWPDQLVAQIYEYLLGRDAATDIALPATLVRNAPISLVREAAAAQVCDARVTDVPGCYTGVYSNDGYGDIVVTLRGATLYIDYYDNEWPIAQASATELYFDVYAFGADFAVPIWFVGTSEDGKFAQLSIPCMPFDRQARLISFTRKPLNPILRPLGPDEAFPVALS